MTFECDACGYEQAWRRVTGGDCPRCGDGDLVPVAGGAREHGVDPDLRVGAPLVQQ